MVAAVSVGSNRSAQQLAVHHTTCNFHCRLRVCSITSMIDTQRMKHAFTLLSLSFAASAIAQPTLTFSGNAPTPGTSYEWNFSEYIDPGSAGAGQVWNFSQLTSDSTGLVTLVDPATTAYGSLFPTATVAEVSDGSTVYFRVANNGVYLLGYEAEDMPVVFSDEGRYLPYPCSHQSTWTDTYSATFEDEEMEVVMAGSIVGTADGYGTLILPNGTLTNVLRVHWVQEEEMTSGMITFNTVFDNHLYYVPGSSYPVVQTVSATSTFFGNTIVTEFTQWVSNLTTGLAEFTERGTPIQLFPVPTNGDLNYELPAHFRGASDITIADASGRTVLATRTTSTHGSKGHIDTGMLPKGIYQFMVTDVNGQRASSRFVVD